jgi:hypothetical protein
VELGITWLKANPKCTRADYIFNRLLGYNKLSNEQWQKVACIAVDWLKENWGTDADISLASVLMRTRILSENDREWVLLKAREWAASPPTLTARTQRIVDNLKFYETSASSGRTFLVAPDRVDFDALMMAAKRRIPVPSSEEMTTILSVLEMHLEAGHPGIAGYPLAALLPVSQIVRNKAITQRLKVLTGRVLSSAELDAGNRRGIFRSIRTLIDHGIWPDGRARPLLREFGLLADVGRVRSFDHLA